MTGPKVPLHRVAQAFVIATSTQADISAVKTDTITDELIKGPKVHASRKFIKTEVST